MSQVTQIAPEILFQIFDLLPKETQNTCQFICKAWHYPAKQVYFNELNLKPEIRLSKLFNSLETTGGFIHVLKINQHKELRFEQVKKLMESCPSLYELQVYNNPIYFQWLWQSTVYLDKLKVLSMIGKLSWRSNENNPYFYLVAYMYRQSLENLEIPCTCSTVLDIRFSGIMHYLSCFPNLKHLSMINGSQKVLIYFDTLLNTCKNLQSLVMDLGHPLYDPTITTTATNVTTTTYPNLYKLGIFLTKFDIEYFKYIINRFINLKELNVSINQSTIDWERDEEEIYKFIKNQYLSFINKLKKSALTIKMNGYSTIDNLFINFGNEINSNTMMKIKFQIENGRSERTDIKLETKQYMTNINYIFIRNFSLNTTLELPFVKHLINYGTRIQSLEINISKSILKSIDFGFILNQCQNLKELVFKIEQVYPRQNTIDLQLNNSTPNVLYFNQKKNYYNSILNLNLIGCILTPQFIQSLSIQAQNIKILEFINCSFQLNTKNLIQYNMSNLNLDKFILDTLYFASVQPTCFKITIKNHSKYYLLDSLDQFIPITYMETKDMTTIEFLLNALVTMEISVSQTIHKQSIKTYSFQ